ncbi:MAG: O-antigen ligase family protein [Omnitrophica WOR_2 bacterium]
MTKLISNLWSSPRFQALSLAVWASAIFLLPVTSLPLLKKISGASTVAPPSTALFLLLAVLWLVPYLLLRKKLPIESVPLLVFIGIVLVSWGLAFFREIPPFRDRSILTQGLDAFLTLGLGLAAYFVPSAWLAENNNRIKLTLQVLNWSGLILLAWSLFQAVFVFANQNIYPDFMVQIQHLISSRRDPLFTSRVTGMAYEPSWLAHQLNMIYLPIWVAASLQGITAHRRRFARLTFENLLLAGGLAVLYISFSRVGWISFFLVAAYVALGYTMRLVRRIGDALVTRIQKTGKGFAAPALFRIGISGVLLFSFIVFYLASAAGLVYLGAQFEPRLKRVFELDYMNVTDFYDISNKLAIAERVVYWATGMGVYNDHPFLGAGLGNVGFYFPQQMPAFGWGLTEISELFNYRSFMPNTKSLWVRILAETGFIGFAFFLGWYYLLWKSAGLARRSKDPRLKMIGRAGGFALIAFIIEGFSIDSFALPYFWLAAGLLTAAAFLTRRELSSTNQDYETDRH